MRMPQICCIPVLRKRRITMKSTLMLGGFMAFSYILPVLITGIIAETPQTDWIVKVGQSINMTKDILNEVAGDDYTLHISFIPNSDVSSYTRVCSFESKRSVATYSDKFVHREVACLPNGVYISSAKLDLAGTYSMTVLCNNNSDDFRCRFDHNFNLTVEKDELTTVPIPYSSTNTVVNESNETENGKSSKSDTNLTAIASICVVVMLIILTVVILVVCRIPQKIRMKMKSPVDNDEADGASHSMMQNV